MSNRETEDIIKTDNSVTVTARDVETGELYSATVSHNGSDWDTNNALDKAMEEAHNKF